MSKIILKDYKNSYIEFKIEGQEDVTEDMSFEKAEKKILTEREKITDIKGYSEKFEPLIFSLLTMFHNYSYHVKEKIEIKADFYGVSVFRYEGAEIVLDTGNSLNQKSTFSFENFTRKGIYSKKERETISKMMQYFPYVFRGNNFKIETEEEPGQEFAISYERGILRNSVYLAEGNIIKNREYRTEAIIIENLKTERKFHKYDFSEDFYAEIVSEKAKTYVDPETKKRIFQIKDTKYSFSYGKLECLEGKMDFFKFLETMCKFFKKLQEFSDTDFSQYIKAFSLMEDWNKRKNEILNLKRL